MPGEGPVIGCDMAGDGVQARDWVFDGERVWEVLSLDADGELVCRDPYAPSGGQRPRRLAAGAVAKVRADRADDPRYLAAVFDQARVLRDFWADED